MPPTTAGGVVAINISNFVFNAPAVVVDPGTIVTVTNGDSFAHTFSGNNLDSGVLGQHASYGVAFTTPSVYRFFCSIHPFMNGTINVR